MGRVSCACLIKCIVMSCIVKPLLIPGTGVSARECSTVFLQKKGVYTQLGADSLNQAA